MKKKAILMFILSILSVTFISAQTNEQIEKLKQIEGTYQLDNDYGYSYIRIFENLNGNKDDLYTRVLAFFPYIVQGTYDARKIIQHEDKEAGVIVAKVAHNTIASRINLGHTYEIAATPIWRVDIKDNRIRLIISNKKWMQFHENRSGVFVTNTKDEIITTKVAPFTQTKAKMDKMYTDAFLVLDITVQKLINSFEAYIREGGTSIESPNADW